MNPLQKLIEYMQEQRKSGDVDLRSTISFAKQLQEESPKLYTQEEMTYTLAEFQEQVKFATDSYERGWNDQMRFYNQSIEHKVRLYSEEEIRRATDVVWDRQNNPLTTKYLQDKIIKALQTLTDSEVSEEEQNDVIFKMQLDILVSQEQSQQESIDGKELDSTRYIPTTESNQEDVMQSYRTRQRLLNNEISALKKQIEGYKSNNSLELFEEWYKETIDANVYTNRKAVLTKIQSLKNK
jgi:hypothetical protein